MSNWGHPYALRVSNKDANDMIWTFNVPMWVALVLYILVTVNALVWSCIGLYEAGRVIF